MRLREVKADLWGSTAELLAKVMDQGQIDAPLTSEDKERLVQFLVRAGFLDSADHVYRPPASRGSQDPYDLSALLNSGFGARVRSLYAGSGGPAPVFQPVGGMMQIALAFQRVLGDKISLGAAVQTIRQTADAVRVVYTDTKTGQEREETADFCVCCLPMSVLRGIDVNLSPEMDAAVNAVRHLTSAKMGLQMKRRFWEEDEGIFGGHLWSRSLRLGEFSYPSNDYFSKKGVLLGLAARGESRSYDGSTQSIRRTTLTRMAMGTRETDQPPLWIATSDLPPSPGHPFYARLTTLLDGHHFDRFVEGLCARFYAPVMGRPSLAPGRYFRLLLVGSFEGIDSERGMAWRATDSLAVRSFLRLAVDEAPPDHSTIARTRRLIDLETHRTVFTWVQQRLVEAGRLTGKTIAIDATTLEANAAMRSIVRRDTGESSQAFLAGLATASGIETPTREGLARLDRKRKKKTSNTDWTHPHDPDAKVTKMKDGRTHLAHKAEHAVDMETGAIVAVTLHGADVGDTTTIIETAIAATEQVEDAQANVDDPQALDEIVGDKGYHSNQTLIDLDAVGIRSYVSEPDRGRRDWSKAPEAQAPVYGNRRRMRGRRGRRLMRQRGERIERSFAHLYDTGGMRRTHLRGHTNILKRLLIHAGGFNLGLVMRHLIGIGTPRGLQGRVAAVRATLSVHMGVVRGRLTPISSSHRLIPAVRGRLASLTTFAVNSSAAITCTTGCYTSTIRWWGCPTCPSRAGSSTC